MTRSAAEMTESCRHRPSTLPLAPSKPPLDASKRHVLPSTELEQRRNVAIYYAYSFLVGFYIATGTTVLFERRLGLSFAQIFTLDAIYMLMFILFEIPSGALADVIGRKKTLLGGLGILVVAAFATGSAQNFTHLFLSFFLWAMGFSLVSGSSEALIYDTLKNEKRFHQVSGRALSFSVAGLALAGVVGPLLFSRDFRLPYFASALPFAAAFLAMLAYREIAVESGAGRFSVRKHILQIRDGIKTAVANQFTLWSTGALALVFAVSYTFTSLYQPYLVQVGFTVSQFAYILPLMFIAEALGAAWSERISSRVGERIAFWTCIMSLGASILIMGLLASKLVVPLLLVYGFLQGVLRPLISTYANRHIEAAHRATIISVQVMMSTIVASALLFVFGFLTDRIGVIALTGLIGALVLAAGIPLLLLRPTAASRIL
jgi:MFS family permease